MTKIYDLELSIRSENCLRRAGITTVEELKKLSDGDLMKIRNMGRKSIKEIKEKLAKWEEEHPAREKCEKALNELLDAAHTLLERELTLKKELREIKRKKLELALIVAGAGDNDLINEIVCNLMECAV